MEFLISIFIFTLITAPEISLGAVFVILYIIVPVCSFLYAVIAKPTLGRINRLSYIGSWFFIVILSFSFTIGLRLISSAQSVEAFYINFLLILSLLTVLSHWMGRLAARRARDAGKNPRIGAIAIIPIVGFILFFLPSRGHLTSAEMKNVFE